MKALETDDPLELIGTRYPVTDAEEADTATARCLIEEYALSGFTANEILMLFKSPSYGFPHAIFRRQGTEFVGRLVGEVFGGSK